MDGFDTVCVKLLLDTTEIDATGMDYTPTVHVHPTNITYVFDYQGDPILEAKRRMDTTQIVQELVAAGRAQLPSNVDNLNSGNADYVPEGWINSDILPRHIPRSKIVGERLKPADLTSGSLKEQQLEQIGEEIWR